MTPPRRPRRPLSGEEARLWGEIAKLITPLRARAMPKPGARPSAKLLVKVAVKAAAKPAPDAASAGTAGHAPPAAAKPSAAKPTAPRVPGPDGAPAARRRVKLGELAPVLPKPSASKPSAPKPPAAVVRLAPPPAPALERKERRALERGNLPIEARIDLHGLYQAEAHAALIGFISRARAAGHARVLVVTGKGGAADAGFEGGDVRGVLRRSVPHWLRGAALRSLVVGFEEAGRRHGGAGALYVRLRRR